MLRYFISVILALIVYGVVFLLADRMIPRDQAGWLFSWPVRLVLIILLIMAFSRLWDWVKGSLRVKAKQAKAVNRLELSRDVREALAARTKLAGDNLATAAARLANRNLSISAEDARKLRESLDAFKEEFRSLPLGPGAEPGVSEERAGEFVKFDKSFLALIEEMAEHALELAEAAGDESPDELKSRISHFDETLERLRMLLQQRKEMILGLR
jgi:hypothetical protein